MQDLKILLQSASHFDTSLAIQRAQTDYQTKCEQDWLKTTRFAVLKAYHAGMCANACECKATANSVYNFPVGHKWHPLEVLEEIGMLHTNEVS